MSKPSLERFVEAQNDVYPQVVRELRAGEKRSHWMWFIFPQIAGLGMSSVSQKFAIASLSEAGEYIAHPTLGPRLLECTGLVLQSSDKTAEDIFGYVDAMKFRSCMTLFSRTDGASDVFAQALDRFYGGEPDTATLQRLK